MTTDILRFRVRSGVARDGRVTLSLVPFVVALRSVAPDSDLTARVRDFARSLNLHVDVDTNPRVWTATFYRPDKFAA